MSLILIILYGSVGTLLSWKLILDIRSSTTWRLNTWVMIWLLIYYIAIPLIMILSSMLRGEAYGIWPDLTIKHKHYSTFGTLLAIVLFFFSYFLIYSQRIKRLKVSQNFIPIKQAGTIPIIKILVVFITLFAFISFIIYARGYQGISNLLKLAPYLESPVFQEDLYEQYGRLHRYFLRFIPLIIYPLFFYKYFRKKHEIVLFLLIPVIVYMVYTLLTRERQATVLLLIVMILGWQIKKNRYINYQFILITIGLISLFPLITFLNKSFTYNYSAYVQLKETINMDHLIQQFNFEQISLYLSQQAEYKKFILDDFINSLFGNFLPTSMRYKEPLNNLNSFLFLGQENHSVPPGIIAAGFYHLGYAGVILWGILLGFIVKITEVFFDSLMEYDSIFVYSYAYTFMVFFAYIRTGILGYSLYRPLYVTLWIILLLSYRFLIKQEGSEKKLESEYAA